MNIKLERPIVFFDLETTGIDIVKDRIVQIGAIKIHPNGDREVKNRLINPGMPIPAASTAVHGISDEDVKDAPRFEQVAKAMHAWLLGADLAGFNSDKFDIPMLAEAFAQAGIEYPTIDLHFIDVMKIEKMLHKFSLVETYQRYTGEELIDAHDALADIEATITVFEHQVQKHEQLQVSVAELEGLFIGDIKKVDLAGKIYEKEGIAYWNFGKLRDQPVKSDIGFAQWVLSKDFPRDTKKQVQRILNT